jgi:hypothetical protein
MQVTLEIPDDLASELPEFDLEPGGLSNTVLEYFAVEA